MASQCIACPSCQKNIKPATLPPLGARVRCPFCKEPFTVEEMLLVNLPAPQSAPHVPVAQSVAISQMNPLQEHRTVPIWAWFVGGATAAVVLVLIGVLAASMFMTPASVPQPIALNSPQQSVAPAQSLVPAQTVTNALAPTKVQPPVDPPVVEPPQETPPSASPEESTIAPPVANDAPMEPATEPRPSTEKKEDSNKAALDLAPEISETPKTEPDTATDDKQVKKIIPAPASNDEPVPLFGNDDAVPSPKVTAATKDNQKPAAKDGVAAQEVKIADKLAKEAVAKGKFNYNLKNQFNYGYQFEFSLAGDGTKLEPTKGTVSYSIAKNRDVIRATQQSLTEQAFRPEPVRGSATAFVVNPNGWLITCAHCARNVEKIEATINGRTFVARVIQIDDAHDLALLKIEAKDLEAIPLVARDIAQGEDANVAGYPLGDVLGNSMKITFGHIAGFVNEKGERWLQLDTSVNPGNSGGPVLSSKGEVLGVVSGALMGERLDRVGIATEIGPVRELMKKNKVPTVDLAKAEPLSGTELAKKVTKSIIQINLGIKGKSDAPRIFVDYYGYTIPSDAYGHVNGTVGVTTKGEFVSQSGQSDTTLFSTSLGMMAFEDLPPDGQKQWQNIRQRSISYLSEIPRYNTVMAPGIPSRYLRNPYAMMQPFNNVVLGQVVIEDTINYEITKTEETTITVKTKTKSIWSNESRTKEIGQSEGSGEYTFDAKKGVTTFGKSQFKLKLTRENGIETSIPMRLVYKLDEVTSDQQQKEQRAVSDKKSKESRAKYEKERNDKYAEAIKTVKNPKSSNDAAQSALSEISHGPDFSGKITEAEKKDVSPFLNRWLESEDSSVRSSALQAIRRFATEVNIVTLLKLLQSVEGHEQGTIVEALGNTGGNEKVAKMITKIFEANEHDFYARHALEKMPKYAEAPVLALLETTTEKRKRDEIYDILGKVGGKKSYDLLKKIMGKDDDSDFGKFHLKNAIRDIGKRVAIKGE